MIAIKTERSRLEVTRDFSGRTVLPLIHVLPPHRWLEVFVESADMTQPWKRMAVVLERNSGSGWRLDPIATARGGYTRRRGQDGLFPVKLHGSVGTLCTPGEGMRLIVAVQGGPITAAVKIVSREGHS